MILIGGKISGKSINSCTEGISSQGEEPPESQVIIFKHWQGQKSGLLSFVFLLFDSYIYVEKLLLKYIMIPVLPSKSECSLSHPNQSEAYPPLQPIPSKFINPLLKWKHLKIFIEDLLWPKIKYPLHIFCVNKADCSV